MATSAEQAKTYKGYTVSGKHKMKYVSRAFGLYHANGNFSNVVFLKSIVTQIEETEYRQEALDELRKRHIGIVETLRTMSVITKDAYNRLWAEETESDTEEERTARYALLWGIEKSIDALDKRILDHKCAALFIGEVSSCYALKDCPF